MVDLINFIKKVDKVIPGFMNEDNLLYGPEIKFYGNELILDKNFETSSILPLEIPLPTR